MGHIYTSILIFAILTTCSLTLLSSKIETWRKVLLVAALSISGILSFRTMNQVYGLPSLLESDFENVWVHAFYVDKEGGWIYIWLREEESKTPISYKVIYSEKLRQKLELNAQASDGRPYMGTIEVSAFPLERYEESIDDIDIDIQSKLPPKN